jgi:hypothetical protein
MRVRKPDEIPPPRLFLPVEFPPPVLFGHTEQQFVEDWACRWT